MLRKIALSAAAATLVAAPIAAQAAPARVSTPVADSEEAFGNFLWPVLGAIILGVIVILLVDGDDEPVSP